MALVARAAVLSALILSVACNGSGDDTDVEPVTESPGDSAFLASIFPTDGAGNVAVDTAIEIEFTTTVTGGERSISLRRSGSDARVPVTVEWFGEGTVMVATPDSALLFDALYTVEIDESVQSTNPAGDDFGQRWSFFTEAAPALALNSAFPADQSDNNSVFIDITATFDAPIAVGSVTADSAYLVHAINGEQTSGDLSVSGDTITFLPLSPLQVYTLYTMVYTTDIEDTAGSPLARDVEVTFGTVPPLQVLSTTPARGAINVSIDQPLVLTFSQDIDPALINNQSLVVEVQGLYQNMRNPDVPGSVTVAGNTLSFTPAGGTWQEFETFHTVRVDANTVRGIDGEPLNVPSLDFTTELVSSDWTYHLSTEGSGRTYVMQTYSGPQTVFMGVDDTRSSRWRFSNNTNGSYGMRTDYGGVNLWLEGGDGSAVAEMTTGGLSTGQQWIFTNFGEHYPGWTQQGFESPNLYYMETVFQGSTEVLTMITLHGNPALQARMETETNDIHSLFWLKRKSPVN